MKKILLLTLIIITMLLCVLPCKAEAAPFENENISLQTSDSYADSIQSEEEKLLSKTVTEYVRQYTSEIFCSLTFIGSLITAFLYKKGLLPTLSEGINKICSIAVRSGEKATDIQNESKESINQFMKNVVPILEKAGALTEYAEILRQESQAMQNEIERERAERDALSKIIEGQTDLLYGVFMSASLPEYQKEQLSRKYDYIKSVIGASEKKRDENESVE